MSEILTTDYKISFLQNEYKFLSKVIFNLEQHVNKLNKDFILNLNEKNIYMKKLNDILKNLNTSYNSYMAKLCESNLDDFKDTNNLELTKKEVSKNIEDIKILEKIKLSKNLVEANKMPLFSVKKDILLVGKKIGFSTLHECLLFSFDEVYENIIEIEDFNKLKMLSSIFIPVRIEYEYSNKINSSLVFRELDSLSEGIIENCIEIWIKKKQNLFVVISGYILNDNLNIIIKTSQISNNFLFQKKKLLENIILNKTDVSEKFRKNYTKNLTIRDLLVFDEKLISEKLINDYSKYRQISKLTFMKLMKEFVKDDNHVNTIQNMIYLLKLLLTGDEDNINTASLLFGLTKEKKINSEKISDIIYDNLNYNMQIKLKKANISLKAELEKIKSLSAEDIDFKKQVVLCKNMPESVKKLSFEKIDEMKSSNNEYHKQLLYVKTLLNYPWPNDNDDNYLTNIGKNKNQSINFLDNIKKQLDFKVYGHFESKEYIKEIMAKWIKNPKSSGSAIGLVGPPGVGKTLIAKAIGTALDIPFVQITLGGQNDGELLHGHGYTYSGAQPGLVVKKMVEAGSPRCIMYFDELDKATKKNDGNDIYNILIHMTDPNMNKEFQDRFFQEICFPLDKVIFIFSYNDSSLIDPVLLDRITEINTKPYSHNDKINITRKFLMKEMTEMISLPSNFISINDDDIKFIIENYTNEAGVRDLKRKLEKIFLKINIDIIYGRIKNKKSLKLTKERIIKYLSKSKREFKKIHEHDSVGVVNGLYATESGFGGITPIQIFNNYTGSEKKFNLKFTGRQGEVMKESVMSGLTTAMHSLKNEIRHKVLKNHPYGLHIHAPCGAVPKDGPSAGCAFATAFMSRFLNLKIKRDIAMTGEIEPTGKITKIGGLCYKLNGAKKAGVKEVFVSEENKDDLLEIKKHNPEIFKDDFKVSLVKSILDVYEKAIINFNPNVLDSLTK